MNGPERMVTCWTFVPATPAAVCEAVTVPMMERVPVEVWNAPLPVLEPPVAFPVMFIVPVETLLTPYDEPPAPPITFPVIFIVPVELLKTPQVLLLPDPPVQFPVIFRVPVPRFEAPLTKLFAPPVQFPTIEADAGEFAVNSKRVVLVLLTVTFAVSVTPSERTNFPVPALLISSQVVLTSIVIV